MENTNNGINYIFDKIIYLYLFIQKNKQSFQLKYNLKTI